MSTKIDQVKKSVSSMLDNVINFVYPPQCVICESLHESSRFFVCPDCELNLMQFSVPFCMTCRNPLDVDEQKCLLCKGRPAISRVWAAGSFDDFYRPLIHAYKYDGVIPISKYLGTMLGNMIQLSGFEEHPDYIMPVPLHPSRLRYRGFDQSLIMAKALGAVLNVEILSDILIRVRKTKDQTGLDKPQRIENMRNAFSVEPDANLENSRIMLVDDVTTSGATSLEAARALKKAGAKEIVLAVAAAAGQVSFE